MNYLAAPYSDPDEKIVTERIGLFCEVGSGLTKAGHFVTSPLLCHFFLAHGGLPADWEYWQHYSRDLLRRCDELWIVTLNGWETSVGVAGEIKIAKEMNKPIRTVDPVSLAIRKAQFL